jgi:short-subunit dehydrogenase
MTDNANGIALITGASSGLGSIYAERLAKRGYDLIIVARNRDRLESLAKKIKDETHRSVEVIVADLLRRDNLSRVEDVLKSNPNISLLVNNAGVGAATPLIHSDVDKMEEMIKLNAIALMRLTYAAVPAFAARNAGIIINIASVVAYWPEILNGVYAGSKAFVTAFSQSLQTELAETNIKIQVVVPGATATEFWDAAGYAVTNLPAEAVMKAEDTVDAALAGLDLGEFLTIPSLPLMEDWEVFEEARQNLIPNFSRSVPADRYRV